MSIETSASNASSDATSDSAAPRASTAGLLIAALGVVYGDIGTSPLYAFKESIGGEHGVGTAPAAVYGVLSMIFWAVTLVVSIKYVLLVLRADNDGEGGILALLALVLRQLPVAGRWRRPAIVAGLIGAAMFYGDAVITPAISVLSAVEGLEVVSPAFKTWVVPASLAIIVALFVVQRHGTARMGHVFGPVMLLWFGTLAILGAAQIVAHPEILRALAPEYAITFAIDKPLTTFTVLAAVFLALTGGEALYADIGHFGARPIRVAWFWLVMPALVLNYFGQGALVLADPAAARNPFVLLAPEVLRLPLVVLSAAATIIASQAVISGAFSVTAQAVKLGYLPRVPIQFTSETSAGQIYIGLVNWLLLVVVIGLVVGFGTSSNLAAAYGIAVAGTMVVTTLGAIVVARHRWDWSRGRTLVVFVPLLLLDLVFLVANSVKIVHGGWFPLVFGALLFVVFATWKRGRDILRHEQQRHGLALVPFLKSLTTDPPTRVEGTAVFLTLEPEFVPHALLHNLKHNRVLHERVVFLTTMSETVPHVPPAQAAEVRDLGDGCWHVKINLGFLDPYDVDYIARVLNRHNEFELLPGNTSFFLSRQTVLAGRPGGMAPWREHLFAWMMRNAQPASEFFHIPPNRVIEIGTQVVI
jgi:KUP system potassium uptake protein